MMMRNKSAQVFVSHGGRAVHAATQLHCVAAGGRPENCPQEIGINRKTFADDQIVYA
ncbi:MAG: hypothetical protein LBR08_03190 [Bacteroidales bacterium]|jgi:hypothetical protein|nr:hypothetical protein [Bacteroidales bacterium]